MTTCTRAICATTLFIASLLATGQSSAARGLPAFLDGGIGNESQQEMDALRNLYRLRMTFAETGTGAYLTGVKVVIEHGDNGSQLLFEDCGPFFFAAVEHGVYRVSATYAGVTQTRVVDLRRGVRDLTFYWPAA
jgi:hypothetical protein